MWQFLYGLRFGAGFMIPVIAGIILLCYTSNRVSLARGKHGRRKGT